MKKFLFVSILLSVMGVLYAQEAVNSEGVKILDQAAAYFKQAKGISMDVESILEDTKTKVKKSAKVHLNTNGKQYEVSSNYADMLFDGKNLYSYNKKDKEITVSEPDMADFSDINITTLLTTYKQQFKVSAPLIETANDKELVTVQLFPNNRNASFYKISLTLESATYLPVSVATHARNGVVNTLKITKINTNETFSADYFQFNADKYPNAQIIDIR